MRWENGRATKGFEVDKAALGQTFSPSTSFSLSVSLHQCSIFLKSGARDDKCDYQFGGPQITQIKRAEKLIMTVKWNT
jgi:hypothetical protein